MRITNSTTLQIISLICLQSIAIAAFVWFFLRPVADSTSFVLTLILAIVLPTVFSCFIAYFWITRPLAQKHQAIESGLANFKDNEFDISLVIKGNDVLNRISVHYNMAAEQLRQSKHTRLQREILLNKVIQVSPMAMVLVDQHDSVIYSNTASQQLFNQAEKLDNRVFSQLLKQANVGLNHAIEQQIEGLFSLNTGNETQVWHLSQNSFQLNHQTHQLYLFKQLTRELNQAEVKTWKKAIKIINHELNNSLAPILSMLHSAKRLTKTLDDHRLLLIFNTIEARVKHLNKFVLEYAKFVKLPLPKKTSIQWPSFIEQLQQHFQFTLITALPVTAGYFDQIQMEQVLLNILKNAHESGSAVKDITLAVVVKAQGIEIELSDKGCGMSQATLENALLPFYSTKPTGTGLGLGLCKEIVESHEGLIHLHNNEDRGSRISIWLPGILNDDKVARD